MTMKEKEQFQTRKKLQVAQLLEKTNSFIMEERRNPGNKKRLREARRKKRNYELALLAIDRKGAAL